MVSAIACVHCLWYVHYVVNGGNMVNSERQLVRDALQGLQSVFDDLEGFTLRNIGCGNARNGV